MLSLSVDNVSDGYQIYVELTTVERVPGLSRYADRLGNIF